MSVKYELINPPVQLSALDRDNLFLIKISFSWFKISFFVIIYDGTSILDKSIILNTVPLLITISSPCSKRFETILKERKKSYAGTDYRTAIVSLSDNKTVATDFKSYIGQISAYAKDYIKANKDENGLINLADEAINSQEWNEK